VRGRCANVTIDRTWVCDGRDAGCDRLRTERECVNEVTVRKTALIVEADLTESCTPSFFSGVPVALSPWLMLAPAVEANPNPKLVDPTGIFTRPVHWNCAMPQLTYHPCASRPLPPALRLRYTPPHEY